jgi:hypothetical protein
MRVLLPGHGSRGETAGGNPRCAATGLRSELTP